MHSYFYQVKDREEDPLELVAIDRTEVCSVEEMRGVLDHEDMCSLTLLNGKDFLVQGTFAEVMKELDVHDDIKLEQVVKTRELQEAFEADAELKAFIESEEKEEEKEDKPIFKEAIPVTEEEEEIWKGKQDYKFVGFDLVEDIPTTIAEADALEKFKQEEKVRKEIDAEVERMIEVHKSPLGNSPLPEVIDEEVEEEEDKSSKISELA